MDNFNENEVSMEDLDSENTIYYNVAEQNGNADSLTNQDLFQESKPMDDKIAQGSGKKGERIFGSLVAILIFLIVFIVVVVGKELFIGNFTGKFLGLLDGDMVKIFGEMAEYAANKDATKLNVELDLNELKFITGLPENFDTKKFNISFEKYKNNDKFASKVMLDYNDEKTFDLQMVKDDKAIGLSLDGITDGFITLDYTEDGIRKLLNTFEVTEEEFEEYAEMTLDEFFETLEFLNEEGFYNLYDDNDKRVLLPYLKIITNKLDSNMKVKKNEKIKIGEKDVSADKHYVVVDQTFMLTLVKEILEKAQNDGKLLKLIEEEMQFRNENVSIEDIKEEIKNVLDDIDREIEYIRDIEMQSMGYVIAIYKKGSNAVAISFEYLEDITKLEEVNGKISFAVLNEKKESFIEVSLHIDEDVLTICTNIEKDEKGFYGNIELNSTVDSETIDADLVKFEFIEIEKDKKIFENYENNKKVLNNMTKSELEKLFMGIGMKLTSYLGEIS